MGYKQSPFPMAKGTSNHVSALKAVEEKKKSYSTKKDDPSYQVPVQPAENPDLAITGGSLQERINDLEDRIDFLKEKYSEYDRPLTNAENQAIKKLKTQLSKEEAKRKALKK